jgi:hypothetical protein
VLALDAGDEAIGEAEGVSIVEGLVVEGVVPGLGGEFLLQPPSAAALSTKRLIERIRFMSVRFGVERSPLAGHASRIADPSPQAKGDARAACIGECGKLM